MSDKQFPLTSNDAQSLAAYRWEGSRSPTAIIIVAHGMGEHSQRYRTALEPLLERGFVAYAVDHRGHGASVTTAAELGDFGPGGFGQVVADLVALTRLARSEHPGLPIALLGHSMGSMAAQLFAVQHSELIDALALSGSAAVDRIAAAAQDPKVLGLLNASFEPARTPFDWLSRDERQVDAYIADPLCGFTLTPGSFGSMLGYGGTLADPSELAKIRKDLPVYVFSGDHDPLHRDLGALQPVIDRYRAAGLQVAVDLYPGARHEVLNETNRAEIVEKLAGWLRTALPAREAR
jgi:alpha-beta hydrolase superfamily lysophospholipase